MDKLLNSTLIYAVIVAFIVVTIISPFFIPMLKRLKFGQFIREEGPEAHKKKSGTPTMGGVIFILGTAISMLIFHKSMNEQTVMILLAFLGFGIIGFLDDLLKIKKKVNEGLKSYQKMILLLLLSGFFAYYGYKNLGTDISVPFFGANFTFDLKLFYIPFVIIVYAATTNAVNLTDGLDGLCTSITTLVMTFFAVVAIAKGNVAVAIFCVIVAGSLLGFLRINAFPARIFMGDTGSLALGGVVATVAIMLKMPLVIIIVGGVYLLETLSVILQVGSFKLRGKRIFKMAPIHHHFELKGWHETRVVSIFSIVTVLLCLIGFLSLY